MISQIEILVRPHLSALYPEGEYLELKGYVRANGQEHGIQKTVRYAELVRLGLFDMIWQDCGEAIKRELALSEEKA